MPDAPPQPPSDTPARWGICALAAVPVRREPDLVSEMTNQLLFGEVYEVLEQRSMFHRIRSAHDGYHGWIVARQGEPLTDAEARAQLDTPPPLLLDLVAPATLGDRQLLLLRGCRLPSALGGHPLACGGERTPAPPAAGAGAPPPPLDTARLDAIARHYLEAPYQWGGRSPFGIDCSGFTQLVFMLCGVQLPRDSRDQALAGAAVPTLGHARPGDLAFFFNQTSHVGIITGRGDSIIHAAGSVHVDDLDETGIRDRRSGALTHHLTCIRRLA